MFKWIFGLLLGCCSIFVLPTFPSTIILVICFLLALSLLLFGNLSQKVVVKELAVFISGLALGFCWVSLSAVIQKDNQVKPPHNQSAHIIEAEIDTLPVIYPEYCRFKVRVLEAAKKSISGKAFLLKDYAQTCPYQLGEKWELKVKLKPIYGPVNEAGFDYEFYMFQSGIDGKGYIKSRQLIDHAAPFSISTVRQELYNQLNQFEQAGVLQALILGEKGKMSSSQRELLREFGLSHLVAISGLHISIIAGVSFWLLFKLTGLLNLLCSRPLLSPLTFALVGSCVVALLYSALADFSIPTLRALIMWCSVVISRLLMREAAFLLGLKMALLIIIVGDPLSVLSAGFWMSFLAVTVISLLLFGRIGHDSSAVGKLKTLVHLQIAITLILMIPSLLLFQEASGLGLLANLIMIPVFSLVILPLILLAVLVMVLFNGQWLMFYLSQSIDYFFSSLADLSPYLQWSQISISIQPWLLITLLILALASCFPMGKLRAPLVSMMAVLLLPSVFASNFDSSKAELIVYDVGHGLAVLLTDGERHILYDTGYGNENFSAFESYVYPSLQKRGVEQLDVLILSHRDNDHSGGAGEILTTLPVDKVYAGSWFQEKGSIPGYEPCRSGIKTKVGRFNLEFIHPQGSTPGRNNDSCVLKVSSTTVNNDRVSILLTGDIEKSTEYRLAELFGQELNADILIAPHHGSKSSSSYPLIKMVNPKMVIFPTERYSRYRLPNATVLKRYQLFEPELLDTGCLGQLLINLNTLDYRFLRQESKLWREAPCSLTEN
ncbi:DNA internalization-related competence protein ComEC/Rec2 [Kangiella sediminilitoris]|uniref:DNA internalization-related competence protein ComEC/Rec2 n=1 Tax=Kangiella sediminilitoris TaxID=1144748 RepID=A0A1B3BAP3_9GAMM|nr:DNA internalization-related competence protein ComEC/Rec2 [Kangiella sediminilitoris]AOE49878.1 DNA internalization-related competence protein ComEC/Rec2 [Kangiella sediminilitoris]